MNHKKSTQITILLTLAVLVAGGAMLLYALAMPDSSLMRWLNDGANKTATQKAPPTNRYMRLLSSLV